MMGIDTIAVLGGGNGAHALAADISLQGYDVYMYELPQFEDRFRPTLEKQSIRIAPVFGPEVPEKYKVPDGEAKLKKATTDIEEALTNAQLVFICCPAYGHRAFAKMVASHIREGQIIVLVPGALGSLEFKNIFAESGVSPEIKFAETALLPYGTRMTGPAEVRAAVAPEVRFAAYPSSDTQELFGMLKPFLRGLIPVENILATTLLNSNCVQHPPALLLNVANVETLEEVYLYRDWTTATVGNLMDEIDEEKKKLCDFLNIDYILRYYLIYGEGVEVLEEGGVSFVGMRGDTYRKGDGMAARYLKELVYRHVEGPHVVTDRMLTEDVPFGMVPAVSLGRSFDVEMPVCESIITLTSTICKQDFWMNGRTLESVGLDFDSIQDIKAKL